MAGVGGVRGDVGWDGGVGAGRICGVGEGGGGCDFAEEVGGEGGDVEVDAVLETGARQGESAVWWGGAGRVPPARVRLPLGDVELVELQLRFPDVAATLKRNRVIIIVIICTKIAKRGWIDVRYIPF